MWECRYESVFLATGFIYRLRRLAYESVATSPIGPKDALEITVITPFVNHSDTFFRLKLDTDQYKE